MIQQNSVDISLRFPMRTTILVGIICLGYTLYRIYFIQFPNLAGTNIPLCSSQLSFTGKLPPREATFIYRRNTISHSDGCSILKDMMHPLLLYHECNMYILHVGSVKFFLQISENIHDCVPLLTVSTP
uniref:Uncharacterized protein n=1 Tax=Oryza brachyantha TaxID=4533 RepID=J3LWH0_ORYBR